MTPSPGWCPWAQQHNTIGKEKTAWQDLGALPMLETSVRRGPGWLRVVPSQPHHGLPFFQGHGLNEKNSPEGPTWV